MSAHDPSDRAPAATGPYRAAAGSPLGAVVRSFPVGGRRTRYLGTSRVLGPRPPVSVGGLVPAPTVRATTITWVRRVPGDLIEVCEGGVRVRSRTGVLELIWEQIDEVDRADGGDGAVAVLTLTGVHGESVTFDRSVRGLAELTALIEAGTAGVPAR